MSKKKKREELKKKTKKRNVRENQSRNARGLFLESLAAHGQSVTQDIQEESLVTGVKTSFDKTLSLPHTKNRTIVRMCLSHQTLGKFWKQLSF